MLGSLELEIIDNLAGKGADGRATTIYVQSNQPDVPVDLHTKIKDISLHYRFATFRGTLTVPVNNNGLLASQHTQ